MDNLFQQPIELLTVLLADLGPAAAGGELGPPATPALVARLVAILSAVREAQEWHFKEQERLANASPIILS